jgi:hypothetical protein
MWLSYPQINLWMKQSTDHTSVYMRATLHKHDMNNTTDHLD